MGAMAGVAPDDIQYVAIKMFQSLLPARYDWETNRKSGVKRYVDEALGEFRKAKAQLPLAPTLAKPTPPTPQQMLDKTLQETLPGPQMTLPYVEVHQMQPATLPPPRQKAELPPFETRAVGPVNVDVSGPIVLMGGGKTGRPKKTATTPPTKAQPTMNYRTVAEIWATTFTAKDRQADIPMNIKKVLDYMEKRKYSDSELVSIYNFAIVMQQGKAPKKGQLDTVTESIMKDLAEQTVPGTGSTSRFNPINDVVVAKTWVETFVHDEGKMGNSMDKVLNYLRDKAYNNNILSGIYTFAKSVQDGNPMPEMTGTTKKALEQLGDVLEETRN
jgi:hypothetical protein